MYLDPFSNMIDGFRSFDRNQLIGDAADVKSKATISARKGKRFIPPVYTIRPKICNILLGLQKLEDQSHYAQTGNDNGAELDGHA